jgi:HK97 family phage major capsid protein
MLILKEIIAKEAKDLNDAERVFLKEHVSELDEAAKAKFAEVLNEKEMDLEEVKSLITKSVQDAMAVKIGTMSDELVKKFMDGVAVQRSKAIDAGGKGNPNAKDAKKDEVTRNFMKALLMGDRVALKALTTDVSGASPDDSAAGVLIPDELRTEVLRIAETQYGLARRDMLYLPFSGPGNSRKIPALGTSVRVFWTGEKVSKKSTQPKFALVTQTLKKLAAIVPFTEEILEDSAINLTQLIATLFAEAVSKEEDLQFFAGTGTPWTGVLNNGNVNIVYQGAIGISKLTADDLLNMIDATPSGALAGAKFYLNRTVQSVIRKLKDSNKQYIFQNPGQGLPATIWNYPYELSDAFPLAADVVPGEPYILFGNLKQGCVFGDKQQLRVKLLEEATITDVDDKTSLNLAEQDMVALRIVERVGYVVALAKALTVLDAGTAASS